MKGKSLFLVGLLSGSLVMGGLFLRLGYESTWRLWNIPTMSLPFGDLRHITGASITLASGLDPMDSNPGDPYARRLTYPRVWQLLSASVTPDDTIALGLVFVGLFLVGLMVSTPASLDRPTAGLLLMTVFSPAVLFAVERGNPDLLIFFLLAMAISLRNEGATLGRAGLIALAFVLKLYPAAAFPLLLRERRRNFLRLALGAILFAALYFALTYHDLRLIIKHTPRSEGFAYGIDVFAWWLFPQSEFPLKIPIYLATLGVLFLALPSRAAATQAYVPSEGEDSDHGGLDAFRAGSGIYLGTFLLISSYDYRLVFLLFTVPQLMFWARSPAAPVARIARWELVGLVISTWGPLLREALSFLPAGSTLGVVMDELANWTVFLGLAYLLAYSAPQWLKVDLRRALRRGNSQTRAFVILAIATALVSFVSVVYLALLPSDPAAAILGRYSPARLLLLGAPLVVCLASTALLIRSLKDGAWASRTAARVYGSRRTLQRVGLCGAAVATVLLVPVGVLRPDWTARLVTNASMMRLLPAFILPTAFFMFYWFTDLISQPADGGMPDAEAHSSPSLDVG